MDEPGTQWVLRTVSVSSTFPLAIWKRPRAPPAWAVTVLCMWAAPREPYPAPAWCAASVLQFQPRFLSVFLSPSGSL